MIEVKHITWKSSAGYDQERWEICRDGFGIGTIHQVGYVPASKLSLKFGAMPSNSYRVKYFATFANATRWLERTMRNVYPISAISTLEF